MKILSGIATTALVVLAVVTVLDSKTAASVRYSLILRKAVRRISHQRPRTTQRFAAEE